MLHAELEVSRATLKRDLQCLRERLDAPIVYDQLDNGYRFSSSTPGRAHERPDCGSATRNPRVLTIHQLIQGLEAEGVLGRHLQPLLDKLHGMLGGNDVAARKLMQRVHIVAAARRPVNARFFELVGSALLERRRVKLLYFTRGRGSEEPTRGVAAAADALPQHLVPGRLVPPATACAALRWTRCASYPCCRSAPRRWRWRR